MTSKIPGFLPPLPKTPLDGKLDKLENKTKAELLELIQRQNDLLAHKKFINTLPDKGLKIKTLLNKLNHELALRDRLEKSCKLLSNSSMPLDKSTIANLEWEKERNKKNSEEYLDSDDDSEPEDPLAIIAQSTDVKKKVVVVQKEKSLITDADIKEMKSFKKDENKILDEYCEHLFDKTVNKSKTIDNYKPYKTTISNSHDPSKEKTRKRGKYWEVTAATPEPSVHGHVKQISLKESLLLMDEQNKKLKEIQTKHAAEKLAAYLGKKIDISNSASMSKGNYREVHEISSDDSNDDASSENGENSDEQVFDEEPKDGGVVFTVMN